MDWELFNPIGKRQGYTIIATLHVQKGKGTLVIGKKLINAGFDTGSRYDLLFNSRDVAIGLHPSSRGRYKCFISGLVTRLELASFCRHYGLNQKYSVKTFKKEGDMWILPLTEITPDKDQP